MNKNCDLVLFLFGTFSLSRPLGFTLHFSCSKLVCGKNKGSPVALQHPCTLSTSTQHGNTWTRSLFFQHASKCDNECGDAHTLCVLLQTDTCRSDCCPLSNPRRQWSSRAAILTGSNPRPLSRYCSLAVTFGELRSLGDSRACLLVLSAPLQTSRSLAVQVYSAIN